MFKNFVQACRQKKLLNTFSILSYFFLSNNIVQRFCPKLLYQNKVQNVGQKCCQKMLSKNYVIKYLPEMFAKNIGQKCCKLIVSKNVIKKIRPKMFSTHFVTKILSKYVVMSKIPK